MISFFFIFLPLFFSERTPVWSGQPRRGSFIFRLFLVTFHYFCTKNTCPYTKTTKQLWIILEFSAKCFVEKYAYLSYNLFYIRMWRDIAENPEQNWMKSGIYHFSLFRTK